MTDRTDHRARQPRPSRAARGAGFTLIELIVVLLILAVLAAISLALAARVTSAGRESATAGVLRTIDDLMTEATADRDGKIVRYVDTDRTQADLNPPADPAGFDGADLIDSATTWRMPLIDGRIAPGGNAEGPRYTTRPTQQVVGAATFDPVADAAQPSMLLLMLQWEQEGIGQNTLRGLDAKFVQRRDSYAYGWRLNTAGGLSGGSAEVRRFRLPVIMDAFGNPIRFVHPAFDGGAGPHPGDANRAMLWYDVDGSDSVDAGNGELWTRSYRPGASGVGDADEGICVNNRPYFYSPGPDGDPGTREDNIYSYLPQFPAETADQN